MSSLLACVGIPASGKSTFSIGWVQSGLNRVRVNRDDLRFMLYGVYAGDQINERMITEIQTAIIMSSLKSGSDVIVDNTNLSLHYINGLKAIAERCKADFDTLLFSVDLEEAIRRNAGRDRQVPVPVIEAMYRRYVDLKEQLK